MVLGVNPMIYYIKASYEIFDNIIFVLSFDLQANYLWVLEESQSDI